MNLKTLLVLLFFILAAVLATVAEFTPAQGRLLCLAVASLALAFFIRELPA